MRVRCGLVPHSLSHNHKKNYVDKGITVCSEWSKSFETFYRDMGDKPPEYQLDRIDGKKGYYKENCRWVTRSINQYNIKSKTKNSNLPKGVTKVKGSDKYQSAITINKFRYYIGLFKTPEEAHNEYLKACQEWYGFIP